MAPQFFGKKSKIANVRVPANVNKETQIAYKLRGLGFKGGLETGWKRAKQLTTQEFIAIEDIKYMKAWFARHAFTSYPSFEKWKKAGRPLDKKWHNKRGIVAWLIWGGDAGFKWANSKEIADILKKLK